MHAHPLGGSFQCWVLPPAAPASPTPRRETAKLVGLAKPRKFMNIFRVVVRVVVGNFKEKKIFPFFENNYPNNYPEKTAPPSPSWRGMAATLHVQIQMVLVLKRYWCCSGWSSPADNIQKCMHTPWEAPSNVGCFRLRPPPMLDGYPGP